MVINLNYFNFNGYACAIKAIFAYKKVVFENMNSLHLNIGERMTRAADFMNLS
jgi:hypothetical protein